MSGRASEPSTAPGRRGERSTAPGRRGEASPAPIPERDLQRQERYEDELIMHLERDQFVEETSRPVPEAELGAGTRAGLWALRGFVLAVGAMVAYTFIAGLH